MPIYEYRCDACGHSVEVFQKFSEAPLETCAVCGGSVRKVLHPVAVHFKGSGFYTTDYGRGSKTARAADSGAKADAGAEQRQRRQAGDEEAYELAQARGPALRRRRSVGRAPLRR